jgi:hypothetical protein
MLKIMLTKTDSQNDLLSDEDISPKLMDTGLLTHGRLQSRHPGHLNLSSSRGNSPSPGARRVMNVCKNCEISFFDAEYEKGLSNEYCTNGEIKEQAILFTSLYLF